MELFVGFRSFIPPGECGWGRGWGGWGVVVEVQRFPCVVHLRVSVSVNFTSNGHVFFEVCVCVCVMHVCV